MTSASPPPNTRPFAPFEWMLATRYMRARRKEGFISVIAGFSFLGITLGIGTLIVVMAVMNGFRTELYNKILGFTGHVFVYQAPFTDYEAAASRIATVPGVNAVLPALQGQVMLSANGQFSGALVYGRTESGIRAHPLIANNVATGTLDGFDAQAGIAIGMGLATALRVNIGDSITLISPRGASTPFGTVPHTKPYRVAAIFEVGMTEFDRSIVIMPINEAQRYLNRGGEIDYLEVMLDDPEQVEPALAAIRIAAGPRAELSDWRQRNSSYFTLLKVERITMFIVMSLIVLVAALNIVSGLLMLVKDKGRDIAVLRTMGATKGAVMRVFLITGTMIGVTGTLAGLVLAILFCANIESIRQFVARVTNTNIFDPAYYFLSQMPAHIDVVDTSLFVLMGITLSVLATLYPSWRASTLDPVEALRYE